MSTQLDLFDNHTSNNPILKQLEQLQELTPLDTVPGVYCWYIRDVEPTDDFIPMYIGQSKNMWGRWLQHRQGLSKVSARATPFSSQEITEYRSGLYVFAINTLLRRKYSPPFGAIAKILERSITDDRTSLMERERYFVGLFQTESKGFNQPLAIEWRHGMKANQNDREYWLTLLKLGGSSIDILHMCPFLDIVEPVLLDYLREERKDYIRRYTKIANKPTKFAQRIKVLALSNERISQYLEEHLESISKKRTENNLPQMAHTPEIEKIIRGSP